MARKFLTDIDLALNQLKNGVIEVRTSNPSSGVVGQVYYNSATSRLVVCTAAGTPGTWSPLLVGPVTSADIQDGTIVNADVSASAAIALSKLAQDPLARANHTGTQPAATISDFASARDQQRLDQHQPPTNPVSLNNQRLAAVGAPFLGTDAATKDYVDTAVTGFTWKPAARVATTANVSLVSAPVGIDSVTLALDDRVLVKNQTTWSENGIYVFNGAGMAMTRATDADTWQELAGAAVIVQEGIVNEDTVWLCTSNRSGTLGSSAVTWVQFPGAGALVAGNGLTRTGNVFDVGAGTGITVAADTVAIDTAVVARKYTTLVTGTGSATSFTVTHNLGMTQPVVQVFDDATGALVDADVTVSSSNAVAVAFAAAPASGVKYRVTVIG